MRVRVVEATRERNLILSTAERERESFAFTHLHTHIILYRKVYILRIIIIINCFFECYVRKCDDAYERVLSHGVVHRGGGRGGF